MATCALRRRASTRTRSFIRPRHNAASKNDQPRGAFSTCESCPPSTRTLSRRRLVRLTGIGAGGAALSIAGWSGRGGIAVLADEAPHWSYEGEEGPEHWGELDPSYAACSGGTAQSPIDVTQPMGEGLVDLEFAYESISPLQIINNGHTIQVNVPAGQSMTVDGVSYHLKQFHFHTPSEHTIDGQGEAMELHLVHQAEDQTLAVVGVLLHEGMENAALKPVFEAMPVMPGPEQEVTGRVDLNSLLPETRTTYRYSGSLTTPPCSEGVLWRLFTVPIEVSTAQVEAFRTIFENDARPVQPANDREIAEDTSA